MPNGLFPSHTGMIHFQQEYRKATDIYYREAGVASWSMEDKRSVALAMWQQALSISGYVLEYQLAIVSRVHGRVIPFHAHKSHHS